MEQKQKINCTVESCRYNDCDSKACTLKQIQVEPMKDCHTCTADESMCGSYEYQDTDE